MTSCQSSIAKLNPRGEPAKAGLMLQFTETEGLFPEPGFTELGSSDRNRANEQLLLYSLAYLHRAA